MESDALVLIVDDNHDARRCVQRILENAGFRVALARDGQVALDVLSREHIDLILADVAMPRMNGYQLFETMMRHPDWVGIPFVFLSARALDSDVRYAKLMGVDDYITKPFGAEELLTIVRGKLHRAELRQRIGHEPEKCHEDILTHGNLQIDLRAYRVSLNGEEVSLSSREFQLLRCLAENHGDVVPLTVLVKATHELETDAQDAGSLIRPLVRSVRRKLGYGTGEWGCIRNVRGIGYRIVTADT